MKTHTPISYGSCYIWDPSIDTSERARRYNRKTEILVYPDDNGLVNFVEPTWIDILDRALIVLGCAGIYVQVLFDEKIFWILESDINDYFVKMATDIQKYQPTSDLF